MRNEKINIVVLLGGISPERKISKESGKNIYSSLARLNYNVKLIDPGYGFNQPKNTDDYFNTDDFSEVSSKNTLNHTPRFLANLATPLLFLPLFNTSKSVSSAFHAGNTGSNPVGDASIFSNLHFLGNSWQ